MNGPARAIAWQLWRPRRWAAAGFLVGLVVLAAAARWVAGGAKDWRTAVFMWCIPFCFGAVGLLSAFALPEGDLLAATSGYPVRMFTLPVSSRELVLWPMLYGGLFAAATWIAFSRLVLSPLGLDVPLAWPAALGAGCIAWVQTLLWAPLRFRYLRVLLAVTLLPALITAAIQIAVHGVRELPLFLLFSGIAIAAYPAAVAGVAAARGGSAGRVQSRPRATVERPVALPHAWWFLSGLRAQLWFELRNGAAVLPILAGGWLLLMSIPLLWCRELAPLGLLQNEASANLRVNLWLSILQTVLFTLPMLGAILGCGRRGDTAFPIFLATQPLSPLVVVTARFLAAAVSCLAAWAITIVIVTGWLLLPAQWNTDTAPLLVLAAHVVTARDGAVLGAVLFLLVLWTWKSQVQGAWTDLYGRKWLTIGLPYATHSLFLIGILFVATRLQGVLRGDPDSLSFLHAIPAWLLALAAVKVVLGPVLSRFAVRSGAVTAAVVYRLAAAWLVATLTVFGILSWLTAQVGHAGLLADGVIRIYAPFCGPSAPPELHRPLAFLVAAALFMPFNRLLAAPLALSLRRQR